MGSALLEYCSSLPVPNTKVILLIFFILEKKANEVGVIEMYTYFETFIFKISLLKLKMVFDLRIPYLQKLLPQVVLKPKEKIELSFFLYVYILKFW